MIVKMCFNRRNFLLIILFGNCEPNDQYLIDNSILYSFYKHITNGFVF